MEISDFGVYAPRVWLIVVLFLILAVPSYCMFWVSTTALRWVAAKRFSLLAVLLSCLLVVVAVTSFRHSDLYDPVCIGCYKLAYRIVYGAVPKPGRELGFAVSLTLLTVQMVLATVTEKAFVAAIWAPWSPFLILYPLLAFVKLGRRLIQPLATVVVQRLYESKQGVLTQIGVGVGALAKLVQESLKH